MISAAEDSTSKYNTTYIYHEATYVHNVTAEYEASWIRSFISTQIKTWKSIGKYLKLFQLTKALHETPGCAAELGDGRGEAVPIVDGVLMRLLEPTGRQLIDIPDVTFKLQCT